MTGDITSCVKRKSLFGSSFCDGNRLACPNSPWISVDAFRALSHKYERMSLWLVTDDYFRRIQRIDVRPIVFDGVDADHWACYVTTSYKKHGALGAVVNSRGGGVIRFENEDVDCTDLERSTCWFEIMKDFQRQGISRSMFEAFDIPANLMSKIGYDVCRQFNVFARDKWRSSLWRLLCYLLPSKEEMKADESVSETITGREVKVDATEVAEIGTLSLF